MIEKIIIFTAVWIVIILIARERSCQRMRRQDRRKGNDPIRFKDRRRTPHAG